MSTFISQESIDSLKKSLIETEQNIKKAEQAALRLSVQQENSKKDLQSFYLELTELVGDDDLSSLVNLTNEITTSIEVQKEQLQSDLRNVMELIEQFDKL